mmetsp:Transcript_5430/g.4115  ORF Transcript_5430/g.4115 Transcript_5430/m.4115 type:complete len:86 (+) Transcript_5430:437-694(+)
MAELKKARDLYNVNFLGYYKGGVPKKGRGAARGKSIGNVGEFHQPELHNFLENPHQDTKLVNTEDALMFKHWMGTDEPEFNRHPP